MVFGSASPTLVDLDDVALGLGGFKVAGQGEGDEFGERVAAAGDVDGDGFDDFIVGAEDNSNAGGYDAGAAYVIFGGDFTNSVDQLGTAGNDILTGSAGVDVLVGNRGDDVLIGNGGADVLLGGQGDDVLRIVLRIGDDFSGRFDGGLGDDTLALQNTGLSLDLTSIGDTRITGIETIDLTGSGSNNTLTLSATDVAAMSDTNTLTVLGDATDALVTTEVFTNGGTLNVGGTDFQLFTSGAATLLVDTDVTVSANGVIDLSSLDGNNGFSVVAPAVGGETDSGFGIDVALLGDINGDGFADLIIGAYNSRGTEEYPVGEVTIIFGSATIGASGSVDAAALSGADGFRISGLAYGDSLGISVASAGDVDGDGFDDILFGAYGSDYGGTDAGEAYLVFGSASVGSGGTCQRL